MKREELKQEEMWQEEMQEKEAKQGDIQENEVKQGTMKQQRDMSQMEAAKRQYDETEIPDELSDRIQSEIGKATQKRKKLIVFRRRIQRGTTAAAAAVIVFTAALNTNTAFAETAGNLPVIGTVARVLTFRSYETEQEDMKISVEIPSIEMISEDFQGLEQSVNEEILRLCEQYANEAKVRAEEYRQAFLDTGGTEEEWAAHNIEIRVWYEVKAQTEKYLSLAIIGTENWSSAYNETRYYNFDLEKGSMVTLQDMLGENFKETANSQIRAQMEERRKEGTVFFDGFEGINENTPFYLNEEGNPVIVFEAYEIAPGSEGQQEFVIDVNASQENASQEDIPQENTEAVGNTANLEDLAALLGKSDEETADKFGGGAENWSADHAFYIGRTYEVEVDGIPCKAFTTCSDDKIVESVSLWIVSGERQVEEAEVTQWRDRVTEMMGTEPVFDEQISEGGSKNCRWTGNGIIASMNQMTDILTVSFQPAVGELK